MSQRKKFRPTVNGLEERLALNAAGAAGVVHSHMATVEVHKSHVVHTHPVHHHTGNPVHHHTGNPVHHHTGNPVHHHKVK